MIGGFWYKLKEYNDMLLQKANKKLQEKYKND
jgi:hypothetical protein